MLLRFSGDRRVGLAPGFQDWTSDLGSLLEVKAGGMAGQGDERVGEKGEEDTRFV